MIKVCVFHGFPLEKFIFHKKPIQTYPLFRNVWLRGGVWVGLVGGHGLDRTPWGAQSHQQTVTKTKRSVTKRWWACCQGRMRIQPWRKGSSRWQAYGGWEEQNRDWHGMLQHYNLLRGSFRRNIPLKNVENDTKSWNDNTLPTFIFSKTKTLEPYETRTLNKPTIP